MPYFICEQDHGDWSSSSSTSFSKVNWTWSEKDLIDIVILASCQLTSCHSRICVLWNAILLGWLAVNKVVILPSLVNSQLQFFYETGPWFIILLTLKVPEKLQLYGLYVYYLVHICDFGMLRVKLTSGILWNGHFYHIKVQYFPFHRIP